MTFHYCLKGGKRFQELHLNVVSYFFTFATACQMHMYYHIVTDTLISALKGQLY